MTDSVKQSFADGGDTHVKLLSDPRMTGTIPIGLFPTVFFPYPFPSGVLPLVCSPGLSLPRSSPTRSSSTLYLSTRSFLP